MVKRKKKKRDRITEGIENKGSSDYKEERNCRNENKGQSWPDW